MTASRCRSFVFVDQSTEAVSAHDPACGHRHRRHSTRRPLAQSLVWPPDLALEDAHLTPENQELKPEFGLGMTPIDEGLEVKTKRLNREEDEKHGRPSWRVDPTGRRWLPAGTAPAVS